MEATQALALGQHYHQYGDLAQAEHLYRQALQADPHQAEALRLLAGLLLDTARFAEAAAAWQHLLAMWPNWPEAHNHLGIALAEQGRLDEALASFGQASRLQPDYAEAHGNTAVTLLRQGRFAEAASSARQAIAIRPAFPEAYNTLGNALRDQGELAAARSSYEQALRLRPDYAEAHNNLGIGLAREGRFDEAVASFRRALALRPTYVNALSNLGNALLEIGDLVGAQQSYDAALQVNPHHPVSHRNRAISWLRQGDFERGWAEYEWRWQCGDLPRRDFPQPRWQGQPLENRSILLYAEQGLGDTIQLIRYARLVQQRGGIVIVECQNLLLQLLAGCAGVSRLVAQGDPLPPFDFQIPLLSLPAVLGTSLASIPAEVPYLKADPQLVERWGNELGSRRAFRIGIAWHGSVSNPENERRVIPLTQFEPVARLAGVSLFSMQKGAGSEQLEAVRGTWPITDLGPRLDDFVDTAAVMKNLDLVITCDTAVAHLAGALAVPVWVALPFLPDWRWLIGREDSPWYPTMRLFRQTVAGDWTGVFGRIAAALAARNVGR
jgi:Flp pilus assembly protein TadD